MNLGVINRGWRPIHVSKKAGVGCLFSPGGIFLQGQELVDEFFSQKIVKNKSPNCFFVNKSGLMLPTSVVERGSCDDISAIAFRLKSTRWVMEPTVEPIDINGVNKYRKELDKLLYPSKASSFHRFYVAETKEPISLPEGYNLLIDLKVSIGRQCQGRHISSWLIKGGSNWRVRCEISLDGEEQHQPKKEDYEEQFVYMYLQKDNISS